MTVLWRCGLALLLSIPFSVTAAEELPRWEAGLGIGTVRGPDYRGSDEYRNFLLPIPYFVYRGETLRADRRGVRTELFQSARASLNISATLGLPGRSEENGARAGMPDLDPAFEIGPSLNVRLYENVPRDRLLSARLPLRAVVATDLASAEHIGWVFLPHLALDFLNAGPSNGWNLGVSAGPIYASGKYHDYYYAVRPEFATATRPVYDASGGYSGASVGLTLTRRYPGYWIGAFVRYDDLHGAAFEESPLVRTKYSLIAGVAVTKIIARSAHGSGSTEDTDADP